MNFLAKVRSTLVFTVLIFTLIYGKNSTGSTDTKTKAYGLTQDSGILQSIKNKKVKYERLLIVVIPSYNNKDWYTINLASVFAQNYRNYHVIYTDDASTDGTGDLVEKYIKSMHMEHKVSLIRNKERLGPLANRYYPIHSCPDHAIIVNLDGDDWFFRDDVLSTINCAYEDPNIWLTYGQFINWPTNQIGYGNTIPGDIVKKRAFRQQNKWVLGQPRTFYAWLFKQIKTDDLMENGHFFTACTDVAMMMPLMEMVGEKFLFIPDIVYQRNVATEINVFKIAKTVQRNNWKIIMKKTKYAQIKRLPFDHLQDAIRS
ncbi:MAG: glycosyltransferase family 2 protein [Candidatus Babeliales bacterium]|jgi:glycosyltransferase involved in cell wall biosynthesis